MWVWNPTWTKIQTGTTHLRKCVDADIRQHRPLTFRLLIYFWRRIPMKITDLSGICHPQHAGGRGHGSLPPRALRCRRPHHRRPRQRDAGCGMVD